jgi:hypothetical protein
VNKSLVALPQQRQLTLQPHNHALPKDDNSGTVSTESDRLANNHRHFVK